MDTFWALFAKWRQKVSKQNGYKTGYWGFQLQTFQKLENRKTPFANNQKTEKPSVETRLARNRKLLKPKTPKTWKHGQRIDGKCKLTIGPVETRWASIVVATVVGTAMPGAAPWVLGWVPG